MDLERHFFPTMNKSFFYQKASFIARLGSGSAARSVQGPVTLWGENKTLETCSNLYAISFAEGLNPVFKSYQDTILLVDKGVKVCLLYTSPSPRDRTRSRMPSSA